MPPPAAVKNEAEVGVHVQMNSGRKDVGGGFWLGGYTLVAFVKTPHIVSIK
jgi:ribulose 1,5-bisphosphate synthetase/thiazole synthase